MSTKLEERFFARDTKQVAIELLGKYLVRSLDDRLLAARVTITQAYKGVDKRDKNSILYPAGRIYMYPVRGHYNLNISTEEDMPACVLIAQAEIKGQRYGQINLVEKLKLDKSFDGKSIEGNELWIEDGIERDENVVKTRLEPTELDGE